MPQTYRITSDDSEIEYSRTETHRIKTDSKGRQTKDKLPDELMIFKYTKSQTKDGKEVTFTKADFEKYIKMGNIVKI
jgi:hypothetical protein